MKGKDFRPITGTIELLDGKHEIEISFGFYEQLEELYGDMQTAFDKFSAKDSKGTKSIKFVDVKMFLCAALNACIEESSDHLTPFEVSKLIDINKLTVYITKLTELLIKSRPDKKEIDSKDDSKN